MLASSRESKKSTLDLLGNPSWLCRGIITRGIGRERYRIMVPGSRAGTSHGGHHLYNQQYCLIQLVSRRVWQGVGAKSVAKRILSDTLVMTLFMTLVMTIAFHTR